jgi:hypothetical protein
MENLVMMLTKKEHDWIAVLIRQSPHDVRYMQQWVNDPDAGFTRGICSRHEEMAQWLTRLLEVNEAATELKA